jgi:hypothetical protein
MSDRLDAASTEAAARVESTAGTPADRETTDGSASVGAVDVTDLVLADLHTRREQGTRAYGRPLTTHNGRDALRDAYEEALDLALYLRQAIEERHQLSRIAESGAA